MSLRLITATNSDLDQEVRNGAFRADLYYRVSVASHVLPPLRDIKEDVAQLADNFREVFSREFRKRVSSLAPNGDTLEAADLPDLGTLDVNAAPDKDAMPIPANLSLADSEREYIRQTLKLFDGNIQRSAESLGISRKNLWEKRKKYGLL